MSLNALASESPTPGGGSVAALDYDALQDRATYEKPMEFPTGIEWVLVNGAVTIDHGKHTGAKAGKALRGPGAGPG